MILTKEEYSRQEENERSLQAEVDRIRAKDNLTELEKDFLIIADLILLHLKEEKLKNSN